MPVTGAGPSTAGTGSKATAVPSSTASAPQSGQTSASPVQPQALTRAALMCLHSAATSTFFSASPLRARLRAMAKATQEHLG